MFTPGGWANALYMPPVKRRFIMGSAPAWERMGLASGAGFSGVIIADAEKQVFAAVRGKPQKRLVPVLDPSRVQRTKPIS